MKKISEKEELTNKEKSSKELYNIAKALIVYIGEIEGKSVKNKDN